MGRKDRYFELNEKLTEAELVEFRAKLSKMTENEVLIEYKAAHNASSRPDIRTPSPSLMQKLIQAWKELRKRRSFPRPH